MYRVLSHKLIARRPLYGSEGKFQQRTYETSYPDIEPEFSRLRWYKEVKIPSLRLANRIHRRQDAEIQKAKKEKTKVDSPVWRRQKCQCYSDSRDTCRLRGRKLLRFHDLRSIFHTLFRLGIALELLRLAPTFHFLSFFLHSLPCYLIVAHEVATGAILSIDDARLGQTLASTIAELTLADGLHVLHSIRHDVRCSPLSLGAGLLSPPPGVTTSRS